MNHRERMEATLSGEQPDRPPVALWRHFPVDDQTGKTLAAAHLNFQQSFDFDFLKVTPSSGYFVYDWGVEDVWQGHPHGTRTYTKRVIQSPEDWEKLPMLDPHKGHLAEQLSALTTIVDALGPDTPVIHTVFNPISQAKKLVGDENLFTHLREYPEQLQKGLEIITESSKDFVDAVINETGASGIFFAVQHAQKSMCTQEEFVEFGRNYDIPILQAASNGWLNLLHLHGDDVYFDLVADYPVQIINWHDRETPPDLTGGLAKFPGTACGGLLQEEDVNLGTPDQIRREARNAIEVTGGKRFILGTGCVAPVTTPYGNLMAARKVVEEYDG